MCCVRDCERTGQTRRGMCSLHYKRWAAHGHTDPTNTAGMSVAEALIFHGWTERPVSDSLGPCWEWNGPMRREYGRLSVQGESLCVHRLAYETWIGPILPGLLIRHKCDNPPCINPEHLEPGTVRQNTQDMLDRDRHVPPRGARNGQAILTEDMVREIRATYADGNTSYSKLGSRYGVSISCICSVIKRNRWPHVV